MAVMRAERLEKRETCEEYRVKVGETETQRRGEAAEEKVGEEGGRQVGNC